VKQPLPKVKQQQQPLPKVKQQIKSQQPLPKVKQQQQPLPKTENQKVSKTKSPKVPKKLTTKKIFDVPILSRNAKGLKKCDTRPGYCTAKTDSLFRKNRMVLITKEYLQDPKLKI
jgi:hypothetical protein